MGIRGGCSCRGAQLSCRRGPRQAVPRQAILTSDPGGPQPMRVAGLGVLKAVRPLPACPALQLLQAYKDSGRLEKEIDFSADEKILATV